MVKVKLAFYKAFDNPKTNLKHKIVAWWTRGKYSHVELLIYEDSDKTWYAYTSTFAKMKVVIEPHDIDIRVWDYIDIWLTEYQIELIKKFFNHILGKQYDLLGIFLSQIVPLGIDSTTRWFCSESVLKSLQIAGVRHPELWFYKPEYVHPNKLYKIIKNIIDKKGVFYG